MLATEIGYNPTYSEEAPTLDQIESMNGEAVLEFGAPWCPHCQAGEEVMQEVLSEPAYTDIKHVKVYDGKGKPLGRAFNVKVWPAFILLRDGQEVARIVRPMLASQVRELLQKL